MSASELTHLTSPFLHSSDTLLHQHNQLLLALQTNISREPPEPGVAPWVSANDKPTSTAKPLAGDAAEHRLKTEVMQLPPRVRARIKAIADEPAGPLIGNLASEANARKLPAGGSVTGVASVSTPLTATMPGSATSSSTGLNKDQEIRKRYTQPLIQETQDLPKKSMILERLLPMCYEERLSEGASQPNQIASLMGNAVNMFIKESLGAMLSVTRTNPPLSDPLSQSTPTGPDVDGHSTGASIPGVYTAGYKKRVAREAQLAARGEVKRSENGLLPIEVQAQKRANWGRGREGDLRLAWGMGEPKWWKDMVPWAGERVGVIRDSLLDDDGDELMLDAPLLNGLPSISNKAKGKQKLTNGFATNRANGVNGNLANGDSTMTNHDREEDDAGTMDENDWGWEGAYNGDRAALGGILDDCLSF